jgi:hypothetical protein
MFTRITTPRDSLSQNSDGVARTDVTLRPTQELSGQVCRQFPVELLAARRASLPPTSASCPLIQVLCCQHTALDVRQPRITATRAPRLDRRWV